MIVKPSVTKFKYNLASEDEASRQLATGAGHELVSVIVTAGGSAVSVRIVDSANGAAGYSRADGFLVAAEASTSTPYTPSNPIPLNKGLYVVVEQGVGSNAECFLTWN